MGKVLSVVSKRALKPVQNFAVELRAERIISQDKPIPAPWHPSTKQRIQKLVEENPDMFDIETSKDPKLDSNLKDLYVRSYDPEPKQRDISRPLPSSRENPTVPELGYREPAKITKGKLSIRQALLMINRHQEDSAVNTPSALANEFTISSSAAENILRHFKSFEYHGPPTDLTKLGIKLSSKSLLPEMNRKELDSK